MKNRTQHFIPNFELRSVVLLSALVVGAASTAYAQSTVAPLAGSAQGGAATSAASAATRDLDVAFAKADANKDGKLDKKEAQMMPAVAERFEQLDTNSDGFISREEFNKAAGS